MTSDSLFPSYRQFSGPYAKEIHYLGRTSLAVGKEDSQVQSVYGNLELVLSREGGDLSHVVRESLHFRCIQRDFSRFLEAQARVLGRERFAPASTGIEQPPLDPAADVEVLAVAVIPHQRGLPVAVPKRTAPRPPAAADVRTWAVADQKFLFCTGIHGSGEGAFDETYSMFCAAEEQLRREGMDFGHVVRTWLYLRDMERDYDDFNRARRRFFQERGITLRPASTGIQGSPVHAEKDFLMSLIAVCSPSPLTIDIMSTPTLNEAWMYGSDFSRGLRLEDCNQVSLFVSGTASVDERGHTAHPEDLRAQVQRMLINVRGLLSAHNACLGDVLSAVTYLKDPSAADTLYDALEAEGALGFPNALVHAPICRSDLLCEMEMVAALPLKREGETLGEQ